MSRDIPGCFEFKAQTWDWSQVSGIPDSPSRDSQEQRGRRSRDSLWQRLEDAVPKDEKDWREARQRHAFSSSQGIRAKILGFLNRECEDGFRKLVDIAICCVVAKEKGPSVGYQQLRTLLGNEQLSETTMRRYMTVVLQIIGLMDELFNQGLRHRAFEIILLYTPLAITALAHYGPNRDRFKECFAHCTFQPEDQAELPLYLPFFVFAQLSRSQWQDISYEATCEALNSGLFHKVDYQDYMTKVSRASPVLREPGLDYDPVRDIIRHRRG